ncbi:MAG TPA: tetratricopeptide repeat protein [Pirellulaceae bacterium]|nr:tetratricopeptide repeat protein [Pirellulaceae bacterium]
MRRWAFQSSTMTMLLVFCPWSPVVNAVLQDDPPIEATSLLGHPLKRLPLQEDRLAELNEHIDAARELTNREPDNPDHWVWWGRRTAYAGRYLESVEVYSNALERFPDSPELLRHRGHRWITLRKFDAAIDDLLRAAHLIEGKPDKIEPDGIPNAANQPTSTLKTNTFYHLGLAYYLKGDFESALSAYERCWAACTTNDMRIATIDWMYMTLRRLGRHQEAEQLLATIDDEWDVLENQAYLKRVRLYQRRLDPAEMIGNLGDDISDIDLATYGYGLGNWFFIEGDTEQAYAWWQRVIDGRQWAAFGHIAAEAELARQKK